MDYVEPLTPSTFAIGSEWYQIRFRLSKTILWKLLYGNHVLKLKVQIILSYRLLLGKLYRQGGPQKLDYRKLSTARHLLLSPRWRVGRSKN